MIQGVGMDLVEIDRIEEILRRWGERFARRILAPGELGEWRLERRSPHFLARRFAVKEAASKALGTGMAEGVSFATITVSHDRRGRPALAFHGPALELTRRLGIVGSHVSISDERRMAAAVVVLERA